MGNDIEVAKKAGINTDRVIVPVYIFSGFCAALLIQMVQAGLVFNSVNLYLQPMVRAAIIFIAAFFDSPREVNLTVLKRQFIRPIQAEG